VPGGLRHGSDRPLDRSCRVACGLETDRGDAGEGLVERLRRLTKELPFSLIVTVRAAGLDIYNIIDVGLTPKVEVPV
jgi:hypothetical protein